MLRRGAHQGGMAAHNARIDRIHPLPLVRQCQLLELSRSTAYDQPHPVSPDALALMHRIDTWHLAYPFAGSRMPATMLTREGTPVGRRHVSTLMKRMGIHALYRTPTTSRRHPAHRVYPYLLRHLTITRSHPVWAADIPDLPMKRGCVYLFAVLDWARRRGLAWRLANTLTPDFGLDAVQDAMTRDGAPESSILTPAVSSPARSSRAS